MPPKPAALKKNIPPPPANNAEAVNALYRGLLSTVNLTDVKIADKFEGQERINFCRFCHEMYHNPYFDVVIKGFIYAQVMLTSEHGTNHETFNNGKMIIAGIKLMEEYFAKFAYEYDLITAQNPNFDPTKPFEPTERA